MGNNFQSVQTCALSFEVKVSLIKCLWCRRILNASDIQLFAALHWISSIDQCNAHYLLLFQYLCQNK